MKKFGFVLVISGFWLLVSGYYTNTHAQQETLTLLTYYPAPYGVYQEVQIQRGWGNFLTLRKTDVAPNTSWLFYTPNPAGVNPNRLEIAYNNGATTTWGILSILPSGFIGIGTVNPISTLVLGEQSSRTIQVERRTSSGSGRNLTIRAGGAFSGGTNLNGGDLFLSAGISTGTGDSDILFRTATPGTSGTSDNALTTKMIITGQGNVGIGTVNPSSLLHVSAGGSGDAVFRLEADTDNNDENDNPEIRFIQDGNNANAFIALEGHAGTRSTGTLANAFVIGSEDNDPALQFVTNDIVRMTILTNGYVGIGKNDPSYRLHVEGIAGEIAIYGKSSQGHGIYGETGAIDKAGVYGYSPGNGDGVWGKSVGDKGVRGDSTNGLGVYGKSDNSYGVSGYSVNSYGVYGDTGVAGGYAGYFEGRIAATEESTRLTSPLDHGGHVYDIAELIPCAKDVEPGDVVVINPNKNREVIKCFKELDPTIAGVISDKPQFSLGDREKAREKEPKKNWNFLALAGQVYVKADATFEEIKRGDLLTTSPTPGHAMKAKPIGEINGYPMYLQGCIVGKALEPLKEGKGKILVLVCLM